MYFVSRPRRFGKSMTLWTLKELFEGKRELFKDLWIDEYWDWSRKPNPVIHISFKNMSHHQLGLENALSKELRSIGTANKCEFSGCDKCSQGSTKFCIKHGGEMIHFTLNQLQIITVLHSSIFVTIVSVLVLHAPSVHQL